MDIQSKFKKNRLVIILAMTFFLLGTSVVWVFAQAASSDGQINACTNVNDGTMRIVSDPASCKKNERLLSWNIQGPKGDKGDPGEAGPVGPEGLAGKDGATGPAGPAGTNGLACWDLNGDGIQDMVEDINQDSSWDAADCKGEQGLQGIQGAPGEVGPAGEQGPAGVQGPQGEVGPVGPQGPQGPEGPAGISDYVVISRYEEVGILAEKTLVAECPNLMKPLGGGYFVTGSEMKVLGNSPWYKIGYGFSGWEVKVWNSDWIISRTLWVYAICAKLN